MLDDVCNIKRQILGPFWGLNSKGHKIIYIFTSPVHRMLGNLLDLFSSQCFFYLILELLVMLQICKDSIGSRVKNNLSYGCNATE